MRPTFSSMLLSTAHTDTLLLYKAGWIRPCSVLIIYHNQHRQDSPLHTSAGCRRYSAGQADAPYLFQSATSCYSDCYEHLLKRCLIAALTGVSWDVDRRWLERHQALIGRRSAPGCDAACLLQRFWRLFPPRKNTVRATANVKNFQPSHQAGTHGSECGMGRSPSDRTDWSGRFIRDLTAGKGSDAWRPGDVRIALVK